MATTEIQRIDKKWFEDRIREKNTSARQMALKLQIAPSGMSMILNGRRRMNAREIAGFAALFGVSTNEIINHLGENVIFENKEGVPLVGHINDKGEVIYKTSKTLLTKDLPANIGEDCHAVRLQTSNLMNGWVVFYRPASANLGIQVGRLAIVSPIEGLDKLRIVGAGYEEGYYSLSKLLGGEIEHEQLKAAAPILWIKQ